MCGQFSRTELVIGREGIETLQNKKIAVFGLGGVGGYAVEVLARSGIGALDLFDPDTVSVTNLNRQIYALHSTVGRFKAEIAAERVKDINPECEVRALKVFYGPENGYKYPLEGYSYIVDAIDSITSKIYLVMNAQQAGVPIISAMGAGNKLDPLRFEVADIYKTSVCPLARVMRNELKKRGVKNLKVVYSKEPPVKPDFELESRLLGDVPPGKNPPGSTAFVPAAAGIILAGEVVRDILKV